ncbi:hypothetical protein GCM10022389_02300 [Flavobacterium cheonanense]|uniref:Uncharacterized protein n=2 Tax=Flavobacterium cheonanense TaxID=706183 RepID=A0ABP7V975_9FLAO
MFIEEIKLRINILAQKHKSNDEYGIDEFKDSELLELEAENLIIAYCEEKKYLIEGFPTEKKKIKDELDEDYFCSERYHYYLDCLTVEKEDVADLMWCYVSSFWPDSFDSKQEYILTIKEQLNSGVFYQINNLN